MANSSCKITNEFKNTNPIAFFFIKNKFNKYYLSIVLVLYCLIMIPTIEKFASNNYEGYYVSAYRGLELINIISGFGFCAPIIAWFFSWQYSSVPNMFDSLINNKIIGRYLSNQTHTSSIEKYFKERYVKKFFSKRIYIISVIISIFYEGYFWYYIVQQINAGSPMWYSINIFAYFFYFLLRITLLNLIVISVYRQVIINRFINNVFKEFSIHINPLHEDKVGGFGSLGQFASISGVIGILLGLYGVGQNVNQLINNNIPVFRIDYVLTNIVAVILAPSLTFIPIISARKAMIRSRDEQLKLVYDKFNYNFKIFQRKVLTKKSICDENEILNALLKREEIIKENYPVWPIPILHVQGITLTTIISAISGLTITILEVIKT